MPEGPASIIGGQCLALRPAASFLETYERGAKPRGHPDPLVSIRVGKLIYIDHTAVSPYTRGMADERETLILYLEEACREWDAVAEQWRQFGDLNKAEHCEEQSRQCRERLRKLKAS